MKGTVEHIEDDRPAGGIVAPDPLRFIQDNMRVAPVPSLPDIRLYAPHAGTGLSRIGGVRRRRAPYWAFTWAGGLALARYIIERPETVAGRRVVDLGSGSGLVAIVAARLGAANVLAVDGDAYARAAIGANAALNGVTLTVTRSYRRPTRSDVDLVLAGDVFYAADVGRRALALLDRCRADGVTVLIGDPYRAHLPRTRLRPLAEYAVPDVGSGPTILPSGVFALEAPPQSPEADRPAASKRKDIAGACGRYRAHHATRSKASKPP